MSVQPIVQGRLGGRADFLKQVRAAMVEPGGYAVGKIGHSEKMWLYYPLILNRATAAPARVAFETAMGHYALRHAGLFPSDPDFLRRYAEFYGPTLQALDCVGLFRQHAEMQSEIVTAYQLTSLLVPYKDQEPDRSSPDDPSNCYLPGLRDRRLLLVSPFARLLQARANQETFEAVWRKTGKRWFEPARVEAIEFPYGFSPETQRRYGTSLHLLEDIQNRIAACDFDVALIGAGGLGVPLASFVKGLGKVGISLGGHIQVLFGVLGARWRHKADWNELYFNPAWIDMPVHYRPLPGESAEDYW